MRPCTLDESSLSIGRVNKVSYECTWWESAIVEIFCLIVSMYVDTRRCSMSGWWRHSAWNGTHGLHATCTYRYLISTCWTGRKPARAESFNTPITRYRCVFTQCTTKHPLNLMLQVANLANTKWCKKPGMWPKTWQMGTHLRVLSGRYPMNTNMTGFGWFSKIFASLCFGRK